MAHPVLLRLKLGLLAALGTRSRASSQPSSLFGWVTAWLASSPAGGSEAQWPAKQQMGPDMKPPAPSLPWDMRHQVTRGEPRGAGEVRVLEGGVAAPQEDRAGSAMGWGQAGWGATS